MEVKSTHLYQQYCYFCSFPGRIGAVRIGQVPVRFFFLSFCSAGISTDRAVAQYFFQGVIWPERKQGAEREARGIKSRVGDGEIER